jgi:NADH:ubiquinone oxidoreductase subunit E
MTTNGQRSFARSAATGAGFVVAICVLVLIADYVAARLRASQEDARIVALQKRARTDSSFASRLAAAQDGVTRARRARKARSNWISILLIAAAAGFIASSKWRTALDGRRPVAMNKLVQLEAQPARGPAAAAKPSSRAPTSSDTDLPFVDRIVEKNGRSKEAAILILQAIQAHYRYLPDEALARVCELTEVTPAQIAGTSSFYARFRRSPVGRHVVRVCHGTACHVSGARQIAEELRRRLRIPEGADTDPQRMFTVDEVACLGCCSLAPVLMVDDQTAGKLTPASACAALDAVEVEQEEPA